MNSKGLFYLASNSVYTTAPASQEKQAVECRNRKGSCMKITAIYSTKFLENHGSCLKTCLHVFQQ